MADWIPLPPFPCRYSTDSGDHRETQRHKIGNSVFLRVLCGLALGFVSIGSAKAGVVEDWNEAFIQAVRKETPPPCLVSRNLPIFHLAIHRAVRSAIQEKLSDNDQGRVAFQSAELAFTKFFPSQPQLVEELRARHPGSATAKMIQMAEAAVERTFRERENDGSSTTVHYVPREKPGQWQRTPPHFRPPEFPHWGQVKTFAIGDVTAFRPAQPPALDSAAYADDLNEVMELGGKESTRRTPEQTLIASFWADFSYTTSPAGHWNDIARQLCLKRRLSVAESARVFAVLDVALADTCIAVWDSKYHFNFWRPVTAIQRADEDGNDATTAGKTWESLLPAPPHPEYVSGHSGMSGAAAVILGHFFGMEGIRFEAESDDVKDTKRVFTSFAACAEEVARSRVYGGIHYPASGREGLALGKRVAETVIARADALLGER